MILYLYGSVKTDSNYPHSGHFSVKDSNRNNNCFIHNRVPQRYLVETPKKPDICTYSISLYSVICLYFGSSLEIISEATPLMS